MVSLSSVSSYTYVQLTLDPGGLVAKDEGLDELVSLVLLVAFLDCLDWVISLGALALDKGVNCDLDALPALVTVHSVVTSNEGDKLTGTDLLESIEELLDVLGRRPGSGVATISEGVNVHVLNALLLGSADEGEQVVDVGVDTTVREKTHEVKATAIFLCVLESLDDVRLLLEFVGLDCFCQRCQYTELTLINADNVLPYNTASTDIQVSFDVS